MKDKNNGFRTEGFREGITHEMPKNYYLTREQHPKNDGFGLISQPGNDGFQLTKLESFESM
jgi:hypothetical protein